MILYVWTSFPVIFLNPNLPPYSPFILSATPFNMLQKQDNEIPMYDWV